MKFTWLGKVIRGKKQAGQSIVEISLITPLLLVALYIPVDFGISFYVGNMVGNAAREGARIGSGLPKTGGVSNDAYSSSEVDTIRDYLINQVKVPQWLDGRELLVTFYDGTNCSQYIDVTVRGNYSFFLYQIINLFGFDVPDSVVISRRTQMRYNFQPAGALGDPLCTTATSFGPDSL